jgi:hypothetical protein
MRAMIEKKLRRRRRRRRRRKKERVTERRWDVLRECQIKIMS